LSLKLSDCVHVSQLAGTSNQIIYYRDMTPREETAQSRGVREGSDVKTAVSQ